MLPCLNTLGRHALNRDQFVCQRKQSCQAFCRMENFKIIAKVFFSFLEIRNVGNLNSLSILETERDVVTVVGCVVCCCYGCECGVTVPVLCCDGSGVVL